MITINTISPTRFSFNGVTYHKNFMPFVTGNKIAIINVYDGCITLTDAPTIFSDYTVNGVTYSSVNDLQSALLDVIYTRNSLTNAAITLTTTGNSGAATLTGITLNIPNYIGGTGTNNFLPKFTGASTLGNSLIFDNGTNVGIGTTSPTAGLLHLNYNSVNNRALRLQDQNGIFDLITSGAGQNHSFGLYDDTNSDYRLIITSGGNVGIGTTSPRSVSGFTTLALNNTSGGLIDFLNNGTLVGQIFNNPTQFDIGSISSVPLVFRTADGERMRITSGGNVGIGTTSPAQRLDVNGLINSTNGISVGGEGVSRFWTGTQAAYDAITTKVSTTVYLIT
jgi:hypothetical protein